MNESVSEGGAGTLRAVRGRLLNPLGDESCVYFEDGLLVAEYLESAARWVIRAIGDAEAVLARTPVPAEAIEVVEDVIMPPFFDVHFHWVQDDVRMLPKDHLIEWLRDYTFPNEARFADPEFAEAEAQRFWKRILATGTIGGLCYSSIHQTALEAAFRHAPVDFAIGNVLMTMHSPPSLTQTEAEAIQLVEWGAQTYGKRYAASPRFAPTTEPGPMTAAGQAAAAHGSFIQTHLSETTAEIEWVLGIYRAMPGFETVQTYTEIYDRVGLLGPRTVMGHGIHLSPAEMKCLAESGSAVASCPTSNAPLPELGLGSGLFDFRAADAHGLRWALASDIGGGPFLSMLDVMRSFVSQNADAGVAEGTYIRAFHRSTLAGAALMGKDEQMGNFAPGKDFSYLLLPLVNSPAKATAESTLEALIAPHRDAREQYDACVRRTVIRGETVFAAS